MTRSPAAEHERSFPLFGSEVRVLVGPPERPGLPPAPLAAHLAEAVLRRFQDQLTRFDPASELSRLNGDPRDAVAVSPLLASALSAALEAAEASGGLVDPTLGAEIERAGYRESLVGAVPAPLGQALLAAPRRRSARPRPTPAWRDATVTGVWVRRPPGARFDLGGTAKGLAADVCAARLADYRSFAVDACGDVRIGGARPAERLVEVEHPFGSERAHSFHLRSGAAATSGLGTRIWRTPHGFAHHLLDPSTGEPAWTGVIQATAIADTALEAETIAKTALLAGPERALELLSPRGGVLVLDDGEVLVAGAPARAEAHVA